MTKIADRCATVWPNLRAWIGTQRNRIERFFNNLKHFRKIATRYEKTVRNDLAAILMASSRLWMRHYESAAQADVVGAIELSRATLRKMHHNLFWSMAYNVVAFRPAAEGPPRGLARSTSSRKDSSLAASSAGFSMAI